MEIHRDLFVQEFFDIFEETFSTHHGVYLDEGTSLTETLEQITAAEASVSVGGRCATLAAQLAHVIFYLEVLEGDITGQPVSTADWDEIWKRVSGVTPAEWKSLKTKLAVTYQRISGVLRGVEDWTQNEAIGGSLAMLVHTAYHLGEIRQAMCMIRGSAMSDPG